jgi:hypothetical protein
MFMFKSSKGWIIVLIICTMFIFSACSSKADDPDSQAPNVPGNAGQDIDQTETETEEEHNDIEAFNSMKALLGKSLDAGPLYYEFELRVGGVSRAYYTVWTDSQKMRIDTFDQKSSVYVDHETQTVEVLNRDAETISSADYDQDYFLAMMSPIPFEAAIEEDMFEHVHFEGSALIDGKPCDVYEVHLADLGVTYYLWKDQGLAVKVIAQITGFPKYEYFYRSLETGGNYSEALKPPEDVDKSQTSVLLPSFEIGIK